MYCVVTCILGYIASFSQHEGFGNKSSCPIVKQSANDFVPLLYILPRGTNVVPESCCSKSHVVPNVSLSSFTK